MSNVPKTKENIKKCLCLKCPSYNFFCKIKSMPKNVSLKIGDAEEKAHAEKMFCAFETSQCIDEKKGCLCEDCEIFRDYDLDKDFFCIVKGGESTL
ncbi:DUF2769 domain-containing protein [Acetobacterium paludosum]|nr:DUF2769 domain-containing protein [Acetobacterium paludosum]